MEQENRCVFPGAVADLLGLANRYLLPPARPGCPEGPPRRGMDVQQTTPEPLMDTVLAPGKALADRLNQYPNP